MDFYHIQASKVFQWAIQIEENGMEFYNSLVKQITNPAVKNLFSYLAEEEVMHISIMKEMHKEIEKYTSFESYPDEYFTFLNAFATNIIFNQEKRQEAKKINTVLEAIQFGIQQELDTILYYQEIKKLITEDQKAYIENILEQERIHFLRLNELKKEHALTS